jgi:ABC-type nitrate/sulfonate/bicarbonate transport system ATPase subunit
VSVLIYDQVEALEYAQAHWLAGGMLAFSFAVLLALHLTQTRHQPHEPFRYSISGASGAYSMLAEGSFDSDSGAGVALRAALRRATGFSLEVDVRLPGQGVSAIFGPSGCGKTTLLRCVAGLTRPASGYVAVGGQVAGRRGRRLAAHAPPPAGHGVPGGSLFPHLTVQRNLDFGRRRVPAAERRVSLEQAIELLGIGHLLARRPAGLSGGERQRVAIARALATSPRLLLMDEPLAALDAARKAELLPWFERLARELRIPVLYVTHALDEVARLADHLLLLEGGRARRARPALLGQLDIARAHGDAAGASSTAASAPSTARTTRCSWTLPAAPSIACRRRGRRRAPSASRCACGCWRATSAWPSPRRATAAS